VEEQRRQEEQQYDVRLELDVRHARHEADDAAADHEQNRIGHVEHAPAMSGPRP
jgi:hypothetical protein